MRWGYIFVRIVIVWEIELIWGVFSLLSQIIFSPCFTIFGRVINSKLDRAYWLCRLSISKIIMTFLGSKSLILTLFIQFTPLNNHFGIKMVILNPKMVKRVFWKYLHLSAFSQGNQTKRQGVFNTAFKSGKFGGSEWWQHYRTCCIFWLWYGCGRPVFIPGYYTLGGNNQRNP